MATVLSLPTAQLPPPPSPAERVAAERTLGLADIVWWLGEPHMPQGRRVAHVRALIAHSGFPHPFPRRAHGAAPGAPLLAGVDAVHPSARWSRVAVEAWFDLFTPPGARTAGDPDEAARETAGAKIDARARNLFAQGAAA